MLNAEQLLDKEFLETRCQLIEIAAALDRIDRAATRAGERLNDPRLGLLKKSLQLLADVDEPSRAEQLLMLFSEP